MPQTYCLLVAAVAGAGALALEVLGARVMAPALGSGAITWSALLAVALGMLAVGNFAGGLLSERWMPSPIIAGALTTSSACLVLLSQVYAPTMRWLIDVPLFVGAVAGAIITQAAPLGMLGAITPAILREGRNASGRWAGTVLAAGSCGGIVGALGAGLILLPRLGLTRSYLAVAALLAVAAFPAIWPKRRWLVAGLLGLLVLIAMCWWRHQPGATVESPYGQLEVRDIGLSRVLLIDGLPQTGLPQQIAPGDALRHGYLLEAALRGKPEVSRALVIGLGAGLAPRILTAHGIDCESVEIDPEVIEIDRNKFGFTGRATLADGRAFLTRTRRQYDLIFLDVCTSDRLAWHLFTLEGLRLLRERLSPTGVAVIQFIGDDGRWSASLTRTVETVFANSLMLAARREVGRVGPRWLFAANGPAFDLRKNNPTPTMDVPWQAMRPSERGLLLTDDHFPAELDWACAALAWRSLASIHQ